MDNEDLGEYLDSEFFEDDLPTTIRLQLFIQAESPLAYKLTTQGQNLTLDRSFWLPKSQLERVTKLKGQHPGELTTIRFCCPLWLVLKHDLLEFEI